MQMNAWRTARASVDARARPVAPRSARARRAPVVRAIIESDEQKGQQGQKKSSSSGGAGRMNAAEVR